MSLVTFLRTLANLLMVAMHSMDVNMATFSLLLFATCFFTVYANDCGYCERRHDVTDCSGVGLEWMWPIPMTCSLRTVTLNLNYNRLTRIPSLPTNEWIQLQRVYMIGNPLNCDDVCAWIKYRIITDCNCGE